MAVNKVELTNSDGTKNTVIDLTSDTVTAATMVSGTVAHDKSGATVTGTLTFNTLYTGTSDPSSTLGNDGDIYIKI